MKNQLPRILMLTTVLCLATMFIWPMWRITLIAPQYPDGVTMYIYINKLGGESPSTIQNINILNHYVGMKYIEAESIPELGYFPYIIMGMMALAVIAMLINKKSFYLAWAVLMILLAIAGLYDFYLWEYDYGHSLSDKAPIKIPGASFQPPLFGTKLILNFTAKSFPHISGYLAGFGIACSLAAWYIKSKFDKNEIRTESADPIPPVVQPVS